MLNSPLRWRGRRPQRWLLAALIVIFIAVGARYAIKVLDAERDNRSAILRWRDQILDLQAGVNIWDRHGYPNPPIMAMLLEPVVALPPLACALTWFAIKAALTVIALFWLFRLLESRSTPDAARAGQGGNTFPLWGKALAIALSVRPIVGDLTHGNVNLLIAFLIVAGLYALCRGRDVLAGLSLALAIGCKVTPALFLPYLAWKRAWRALAACAVGIVLFVWLAPGLRYGTKENEAYVRTWFKNMVLPYAGGQVWTEHENQSLPALAYRLLTPSPSFSTRADNFKTDVECHNLAALPREAITAILAACMVGFLWLAALSCRPSRRPGFPSDAPRNHWRLAAEFSIVVLGMLLFSERTWKHHCVTHLLPFTVLSYCLSACRPRNRTGLIAALTAVALLIASTSTGLFGDHDRFGKLAQAYGAYVWGNLIMVGTLAVLLRHRPLPVDRAQTKTLIVQSRRLSFGRHDEGSWQSRGSDNRQGHEVGHREEFS